MIERAFGVCVLALLVQTIGCTSPEVDHVVDLDTVGSASRCLSVRIESVRHTAISSPSINNVNTRAFARSADGKTVRWDYMRSLRKDQWLEEGDEVFLLLDEAGRATGVARSCPGGLLPPR